MSINGHFLFCVEQLSFKTGEKIALMGANAAGKTTFLPKILSAENTASIGKHGLWSYFAQKSESVPSVQDLEQIEGSMLFCSHDEYFVRTLAEEIWVLEDKKIHLLELLKPDS